MLESGLRLFDCEIIKPLSENNVYETYLVSCPDLSSVRLLRILPDQIFERKSHQHFLDQAHWLASQTFPGVGTPLKAGEVDNQLVCFYPLPAGTELKQLSIQKFSVRQATELVAKILQCLIVPHSAGLAHGNLSPETIYIENDTPYLADFALSQLIKLDYQSGIDPRYTSPEQVRGEVPGTAADIYSLGCVLYHLLTHRSPFTGDDAFHIAMQHLQGAFPRLPEPLRDCQALLDSMTHSLPAERLAAEVLLGELQQLLASALLDQLTPVSPVEAAESDPAEEDFPASEESANMADSDLAARIEARLKEHPLPVDEIMEGESVDAGPADATEILDHVYNKDKARPWRYLLILIIGILIGSGSYFLFFNPPSSPASAPVQSPENNLSAELDHALLLWQKADLTGAKAEFEKMISQYPTDPRAYNNLAAIYASQGQYEQAREQLEQALVTNEQYATIYNNLGAVYAEMARDSYGKALQIENAKAQINLKAISSRGILVISPVSENVSVAQKQTVSGGENELKPSAGEKETVAAEKTVEPVAPAKAPDATAKLPEKKHLPMEQLTTTAAVDSMNQSSAQKSTAEETLPTSVENKIPPATSTSGQGESAEEFMNRWARAWSDQDVTAYLTFYDEKFIPGGGKTRADWEAERRERITNPEKIMVTLTDEKMSNQTDGRVRFEATQIYKSDIYSDRSRKVFDLNKSESGWSILRERSLGSIR